jgi:flavodoxin
VKLWIIYKEGIGFSRVIAEMLQDRLEDYLDVSVGNAKKIDPSFLVEERLDYLIIGDVVSGTTLNLEIQNWLAKFWEISKKKNLNVKMVSGFYVTLTDNSTHPLWVDFFRDNVKVENVYPRILRLKLNIAEISLEDGTLELVNEYSNDFIDFFINNEKSFKKKKD